MRSFRFARWAAIVLLLVGSAFLSAANAQVQDLQVPEQHTTPLTTPPAQLAKVEPLLLPAYAFTAPSPRPVPAPASSAYDWKGFYFGVSVGYAWGNADTRIEPLPTAAIFVNLKPQTLSPDPTGMLGGAQFGYNWQRGHIVFGAEVDANAAGIDGKVVQSPIIQNNGTPFPGPGNNITISQHTDALFTFRPRVGFAYRRLLAFGTGGLALGHVGETANTDFHPLGTEQYSAQLSQTKVGWAAGGGAEFGLFQHWSVKGEWLHYDFGDDTFTANPSVPFPPSAPPFQVRYSWQTTSNVIRFGGNWHF